MIETESISAYIFAGGKSRRFGREKSLYEFRNKPLILHVVHVLKKVFPEIIIISGNDMNPKIPGIPVIPDIIPNLGPVGGLYTALSHSSKEYIFAFACDMPFLDDKFIRYMIRESEGYDVTVPFIKGNYEPLHAVYSAGCIEHVKSVISSGKKRLVEIFKRAKKREILEDEVSAIADPEKIFYNVNFMADIDNLNEKLSF